MPRRISFWMSILLNFPKLALKRNVWEPWGPSGGQGWVRARPFTSCYSPRRIVAHDFSENETSRTELLDPRFPAPLQYFPVSRVSRRYCKSLQNAGHSNIFEQEANAPMFRRYLCMRSSFLRFSDVLKDLFWRYERLMLTRGDKCDLETRAIVKQVPEWSKS